MNNLDYFTDHKNTIKLLIWLINTLNFILFQYSIYEWIFNLMYNCKHFLK